MKIKAVLIIVFLLFNGAFSCNSKDCGCSKVGSLSNNCDSDEACNCKPNFASQKCDECNEGYIWYPKCIKSCDKTERCKLIVAGNVGLGNISSTGYIFKAASGDEDERKEFKLDMRDKTSEFKLIGGTVDGKCLMCSVGDEVGSTDSLCFHINEDGRVRPVPTAPVLIGRISVQTSCGSLISLTDKFSVSMISSIAQGWSSLVGESTSTEVEQFGNLLCATMKNPYTLAAITSGPNSKIMLFYIRDKVWKEGPTLDIKNGREIFGFCYMLDNGDLFLKNNNGAQVYNINTGKRVSNVSADDILEDFTDGSIVDGDFGHLYIGGFKRGSGPFNERSEQIFYLSKGTKTWVKSNQMLGEGLSDVAACLV